MCAFEDKCEMRKRTRGSGSAKVREMARVPLGKIPEAKIRGARGRAGMPKRGPPGRIHGGGWDM